MLSPTIQDFFSANIGHPNAVPYRQVYRWTSGSGNAQPIITTPGSGETLYVYKVGIFLVGSGKYSTRIESGCKLHMFASHVSPVVDPIDLDFLTYDNCTDDASASDVLAIIKSVIHFKCEENVIAVEYKFSSPICLSGDSENFTIRVEMNNGTPVNFGVKCGSWNWNIQGWVLNTSDL